MRAARCRTGPARPAALAIGLLAALAASAASGRDDLWQPREDNAAWRAECGACHVPFPPAMLPADAWRALMQRLDRHYGADASLDEPTRAEIAAFLQRNGGPSDIPADADAAPRITAAAWFERKHQGAIRLWRKGRVKSLTDCQACHPGM